MAVYKIIPRESYSDEGSTIIQTDAPPEAIQKVTMDFDKLRQLGQFGSADAKYLDPEERNLWFRQSEAVRNMFCNYDDVDITICEMLRDRKFKARVVNLDTFKIGAQY